MSITPGPEIGGQVVVVWADGLMIQDCSIEQCQLYHLWGTGWALDGSAEMENNKALEHKGSGIKQGTLWMKRLVNITPSASYIA